MAAILNNRFDLTFSFRGGKLVVTDPCGEEYRDLNISNYICLEYLTYNNDNSQLILPKITESISVATDLKESVFAINKDGKYGYFRIMVPRIKKYLSAGIIKKNNIFYYNHKFYYSTINVNSAIFNLSENYIKEVSLEELYEMVSGDFELEGDRDCIYEHYVLFSYENLKKKFVEIQNEFVGTKTLWSLTKRDKVSSNLREKRDRVMGILFAIRHCVEKQLFDEAKLFTDVLSEHECLYEDVDSTKSIKSNTCGCTTENTVKETSVEITYVKKITTDDLDTDTYVWRFGNTFPVRFS